MPKRSKILTYENRPKRLADILELWLIGLCGGKKKMLKEFKLAKLVMEGATSKIREKARKQLLRIQKFH